MSEHTQQSAPATGRLPWKNRFALLAIALVVYGASPVVQNFDSYLALPTAYSIVHHRNLYLDEFRSTRITQHYARSKLADGHFVNAFPWADALFLVPVVAAVDLAHAAGVGPGSKSLIERNHMDAMQLATASAIVAIVVMLVGMIAYERLTGDDRRRRRLATLVALGFAFGTGAWSTASRALWQHGPSLLALAGAVLMAQRLAMDRSPGDIDGVVDRYGVVARRAALLGASLAAAYALRPTNAIAVVVLSVWLASVVVRGVLRPRALAAYAGGALAVAVPWLVVNRVELGSWLQHYSSTSALSWHSHYPEAFAANLVSPARGLLVYSPVVVLAIYGLVRGPAATRGLDRALAACVVIQLFVIAAYKLEWWAGHAYGPRFTTDVLVFIAVLATPAVDRLARLAVGDHRSRFAVVAPPAAAVLLVVSVAMNGQGALSRATVCWNGSPNIDLHRGRVWSWSDPQFAAGVKELVRSGSPKRAVLTPCPPTESR